MSSNYIPDMTERFPEGMNGVDMTDNYDFEYDAWEMFARDFEEYERKNENENEGS